MALRSMIRKIPALAAGFRAPPARAPSSALRPWSRFLSQGTGAAAGRQAVYSEEMLREEADHVHAEFLRDMKLIQQERDELWRMQHNRGQFTSSKPRPDEATSELTAPDGSPNWASVEGRPPSAAEPGIMWRYSGKLKKSL